MVRIDKCPTCDATLEIEDGVKSMICPWCRTRVVCGESDPSVTTRHELNSRNERLVAFIRSRERDGDTQLSDLIEKVSRKIEVQAWQSGRGTAVMCKCIKCGASLSVNPGQTEVNCPYCRAQMMLGEVTSLTTKGLGWKAMPVCRGCGATLRVRSGQREVICPRCLTKTVFGDE